MRLRKLRVTEPGAAVVPPVVLPPPGAVVVCLADTHGGSALGLMAPGTQLYQEPVGNEPAPAYTPPLTATQTYLWEIYQADVDYVRTIAAGRPVVVYHNGDICQGLKYPQQLVTTRLADQVRIATNNMRVWFDTPGLNLAALRLVFGTAAHNFGEASACLLIHEQLTALYPRADIQVVRHAYATIAGVEFDVAHHGPTPGVRNWTVGNQLRFYARSMVADCVAHGWPIPRVIVRAHYHTYCPETVLVMVAGQEYLIDVVVLPSYCSLTEYAQQATRSGFVISNGLVAWEVAAGQVIKKHARVRAVDLRTKEELIHAQRTDRLIIGG